MVTRFDKHTNANLEEVQVQHVHLNLQADFQAQALKGYVELSIELLQSTPLVVLDASRLKILSAEIDGQNVSLELEQKKLGMAVKLGIPENKQQAGSKFVARVYYETTPESTAIQWLSEQQTDDKSHPYLFTQCEAIHARSLLPCQDCPMAKAPYSAEITVPSWAVCLMSAVQAKESEEAADPDMRVFFWEQKVSISSYLIAIVIGNLKSKDVGPRSRIWTEPSKVEAVAYEFAQTEEFISLAEKITNQEYVWGRYDLVSLPASFPYGGMENPCLTFVTPTLLAGDRSLADVIAHEISHSWTGNLITNHTWEDFWLNEGWTIWLQRKIMAGIHSKEYYNFDAIIGWKALLDSVERYGADHEFTKLIPTLDGFDPDDSFSSVPYEKGFNLLNYLSTVVGEEPFEKFAQAYIQKFKYKTITSSQFRAFFMEHFSDRKDQLTVIDWDAWYSAPGMPPVTPKFDNTISTASFELAEKLLDPGFEPSPNDISNWTSAQIVVMLERVIVLMGEKKTKISVEKLKKYGSTYNFSTSKNSEIRFRWQTICVKCEADFILPDVKQFLMEQGRMKFVRPLYRDLNNSKVGTKLAHDLFNEWGNNYHPIARKMIAKDLQA